MKKTVNLGIIGCGSIFRNMHLPAINENNSKFRIISIYDNDTNSVKLSKIVTGEDNSINYADSAEDIIYNKNVDAVAVLTWTSSHFKYASKALLAGKHVFLEKPVSVKTSDADKLISLEKSSKKFVQVGMVLRYSSFYKELCRIIDSKKYGKVLWMNWLETRPFDPYLWRYIDPEKNGDAIIHDKAVHQINLFNRFAGAKPAEAAAFGGQYKINPFTFSKVRAFSGEVKLKGTSNDHVMAIINYKNGVKASITISYVSPHARESRWIIQLERAKIAAHFETFVNPSIDSTKKWSGHPSSIYIFKDDNSYPVPWKYPMSYPPQDKNLMFYDEYKNEPMHPGSAEQWNEFYQTVTKNKKPLSSLEVALKDLKVAEAIDQAIKKKKVIKIKK